MNTVTEDRSNNKHMLCGRPLEYGDPEQIRELKRLRALDKHKEGKHKFSVDIEYATYSVEVYAEDEDEAKELAMEQAAEEIDIDIIRCDKLEDKSKYA